MLTDFFQPCVIMDKVTRNENGFVVTEYIDGARIMCGIARNTSTEAQIAEKSGMKSIFTIVFQDDIRLTQNDRIKDQNGKMYRVTTDSDEMTTPKISDMHFKRVDAEVITT